MLVGVRGSPVPVSRPRRPSAKPDDLWCRSMLLRRWRWGFLHAVPAGRRGTSAARNFRTPSVFKNLSLPPSSVSYDVHSRCKCKAHWPQLFGSSASGWLLAAPQHRGVLRAVGVLCSRKRTTPGPVFTQALFTAQCETKVYALSETRVATWYLDLVKNYAEPGKNSLPVAPFAVGAARPVPVDVLV